MARDPEQFQKIVEESQDLPTLSLVVTRVSEMVRDPRVSAGEVARVISEDQALTAKVLRLVNSSFYGFPQRVNNITRAIVILGFNRVRNLALTASVLSALPNRHGTFSVASFWGHSVATAIASDTIARIMRFTGEEEDAFVSGLLHDIGKLTSIHLFRPEFDAVLGCVAERNCLIVEAEQDVMGTTHAHVGGWLSRRWNFPESIAAAIRMHHQPELARQHRRLVMIVHVADVIARALGLGFGGDMRIPVVDPTAWRELGLTREAVSQCMKETLDRTEQTKEFLEMVTKR